MYDVPGDRVKYQHPEGFMNWLRALLGPNGRSRTIRKRNPFSQPSRPELEGLETRFLLATGITEFASLPTTSSQPDAVTAGPDGNIWFTETQSSRIGRIATDGTL